MSVKRKGGHYDGAEVRDDKRRKVAEAVAKPEEIESARHLQQLLLFSQDAEELKNSELR